MNDDHGITSFQNSLSQSATSGSQTESANVQHQPDGSVQQGSLSSNRSKNVAGNVLRRSNQTGRNVPQGNSTQMDEQRNDRLQGEYIQLQIKRTKISIEKEELQKKLVQIEVDKAELLKMEEVEHRRKMMKLEVEAKEAEIEHLKKNP